MKKALMLFALGAAVLIFTAGGYAQEAEVDESSAEVQEFAGKTYICDKDNISQDEPGKCPVCGADLVEAEAVEKEVTETPEVPAEGTQQIPEVK